MGCSVQRTAGGARPWDSDALDARLLAEMVRGQSRIIDSELESPLGYPQHAPTQRARLMKPTGR